MGPGLCGALLGPDAGFDLASGLTSHPSRQVLAPLQPYARPSASGDGGSNPGSAFHWLRDVDRAVLPLRTPVSSSVKSVD